MQYLNFAGVLALAGLCVAQWRVNRATNLELNALEKTRMEQAQTIQEQTRQLAGSQADLDALREHLAHKHVEWKEAASNVTVAQMELRQLVNERDQLKGSVTNWVNAVAARDAQIKELGTRLTTMGEERNQAVAKFNELAEKYNGVVGELNDRTQQFNELIQRFNKEVKRE